MASSRTKRKTSQRKGRKKTARLSLHSRLIDKQAKKTCPIKISLKPFEASFVSNRNAQRQFVSEVHKYFQRTSIKPNDNFYDYVNSNWLKNFKLQDDQLYIVQVDDFRLIQDKVYRELDQLIVDYIKTHNDPLAKNMNNFRTSIIEMNSKSDTRRQAKEQIRIIDEIRSDKKNLWKMLAMMNRDEIISSFTPLSWSLEADEKDPNTFRSYIRPKSFTLLDMSVYYDDGTEVEYKRRYVHNFNVFAKRLFDTVLGKNHGFNTDDIHWVAVDIFNAFGCDDPKIKENNEDYNRVYADEALEKYGFDWKEFSKELGYKKTPPFFVTFDLNYLKCCSTLLRENWDSEKWRSFWCFLHVRRLCRLTRGWEKIIYDFLGKMEKGQEKMIDRRAAVGSAIYMSLPFSTFLTNAYIAKYKNLEAVKYVETLCEELKIVFVRMLKRNSWMSPSTKAKALDKLHHMRFTIGNVKKLREDPLLGYTKSLYDNMNKIFAWRHEHLLELEGKPYFDVPFIDWTQYPAKLGGTFAYVVNAQYTPTRNEIFINLGYIQKPFIDLDERGIEYNLANIGLTISHEMSHGLDDFGSKYDKYGVLSDWWTPEDKRRFKKIQKDIIRQYEEWAAKDGIEFDASIGIGEDMADISGLAICDEYLRDFQEKNKDLTPISYLSYQAFYIYFAFQMRQKIGKEALRAQLKTNPHPLDKYRTNVPLSRSDIFGAIYNVKRGDGMWWPKAAPIW